jgi:hypothetical protein
MADISLIRQKVQQARQHLAKGELHKARALLKGLEHPKAQALLADVEAQLALQKPKQAQFPFVPVLGFLGIFFVLLIGGGFALMANRTVPTPEAVPTAIPTSDCTSETVQTWWAVQDLVLDTFVADASSASRTMPGERLTERIASLHQMRNDFPAVPECASSEMRTAIADLLEAMDATIAALERWSNGTADGTQTSIDLQNAEAELWEARTQLRNLNRF